MCKIIRITELLISVILSSISPSAEARSDALHSQGTTAADDTPKDCQAFHEQGNPMYEDQFYRYNSLFLLAIFLFIH